MNADAEESLRKRLGALRVDPPESGFEARLRERLAHEGQLPLQRAEVIRPRAFRFRGGRVGLLAVAALCFAGAAAAVAGSARHLALWPSAPEPSPAPVVERPALGHAASAVAPLGNRHTPPEPRVEAPAVRTIEAPPPRPDTPSPPRIRRLSPSLSQAVNTERSAALHVPRVTAPSEQSHDAPERPRLQIPRVQAELDAPRVGRAHGNAMSLRDERGELRRADRGPAMKRPELPRSNRDRELTERFERGAGRRDAAQRRDERPSVERRGPSAAGRGPRFHRN